MITVGIASIPEREESLKQVIDSLTRQADLIAVVLNSYKEIPSWIKEYDNVICDIGDNALGDAMKFALAESAKGLYVSWDDDLVAPPDAIWKLHRGVTKYNWVCSFHGRKYLSPVTNFKKFAGNYRCLGNVSEDVHVDFIGSGCTAFDTGRLRLSLHDFKSRNMADVYLSKAATDQGVPMMVLAHPEGYLKYIAPQRGTTIWEQTQDYTEHVKIMQTFIK